MPVGQARRVGRLLILCVLIGVSAGVAALLFELLVGFGRATLLDGIAGYRPQGPAGEIEIWQRSSTSFRPWLLALLPAFGGLVGGLILRWAPEAEGHGTDAAIDAYHHKQGMVRARVPWIKGIASAITLGTGGSAGREGPIAQMGAGLAVIAARALRLNAKQRRILMVAGMGAGIGAIFRAPLAGALFAAEVLYREIDLEFEVIAPTTIASIVAYSVFTLPFGADPLFYTPPNRFDDPSQLVSYTLLALVVAAGAKLYVCVFYWVQRRFRALPLPLWARAALGGLGVGAFAFVMPDAMGSSYGVVQEALAGQASLGFLLALALAKIITTALTVAAGQSGGVFGPAMVIGGTLSGALGIWCQEHLPWVSAPTEAFIVVGMAGFFAAAANTPLSTIIMVSEMVGDYHLLVPTMWVATISFLLVRRSTLYRSQVESRADSPVHLNEMLGNVLETLRVSDALVDSEHESARSLPHDMPAADLPAILQEIQQDALPVVANGNIFCGVVTRRRVRHVMASPAEFAGKVAGDLVVATPVLLPRETLHVAMHKMVESGLDTLVVVDSMGSARVIATLSRRELIATYDHHLQQQQASAPKSAQHADGGVGSTWNSVE